MAEIRMDVDSCRNVASTMQQTAEAVNQQIDALAAAVNGTVGSAWIAPSANQFNDAFQTWAQSVKQLSAQLTELQGRLNAEIAEFEQAASSLS